MIAIAKTFEVLSAQANIAADFDNLSAKCAAIDSASSRPRWNEQSSSSVLAFSLFRGKYDCDFETI